MTPGSPAAIVLGCRCDPVKNAHGLGNLASGCVDPMYGPEYTVASNCMVHGLSVWRQPYVSPRGEERTMMSPITVWAASG